MATKSNFPVIIIPRIQCFRGNKHFCRSLLLSICIVHWRSEVLTKIILAIVLLAFAGQSLAQDSAKADKYAFPPLPQELKHADSLLAAGDSAKGLDELRRIVSSNTNYEIQARAQFNIGRYYENLRISFSKVANNETESKTRALYARAYYEYMQVVDMYPKSIYCPHALLQAYFNCFRNRKQRIVLLTEIVEKYPGSEPYKHALFTLANKLEKGESIKLLRRYLLEYPSDETGCIDVLFSIGDLSEGRDAYNSYYKIINKYGDQPATALRAYSCIAQRYASEGKIQQGIDIYLDGIERYRNDPTIPMRLETVYSMYQDLGNKEKCEETKSRILREYPESKEAKSFLPK
jgi:tetratricopeptide (TPR) repeat protein